MTNFVKGLLAKLMKGLLDEFAVLQINHFFIWFFVNKVYCIQFL